MSPSGARLAELNGLAKEGRTMELESKGSKSPFSVVWVDGQANQVGVRTATDSGFWGFNIPATDPATGAPKTPSYQIFDYSQPRRTPKPRNHERFGCEG